MSELLYRRSLAEKLRDLSGELNTGRDPFTWNSGLYKKLNKSIKAVLKALDDHSGEEWLSEGARKDLEDKIKTIRVAIDLLTPEDLSDKAHLETYQSRMKKLYHLDKFAFVDTEGLIFTSTGIDNNIDEYDFVYRRIHR